MSESQGPSSIASSEWKHVVLLGLIIWLGFGLRMFHLGYQDLRGDEAFDALFSSQSVGTILTQLQVEQPYPPLFHVGLHYWLDLVGQSEIMQRLPALISSVLLVPLTYQLARLLLTQTSALIAAALAAINPFYIWHAQDGRMYALLAAFSLASIWLGLRLLQEPPRMGVGLAYWLVTVLSLLTHYFAWWVVLAENMAAMLVIWREEQRRSRLSRWLMWQGAVLVPVLPWLVFASGLLTSHASGWIPPLTPFQMLERGLTTFSLGLTSEPTLALPFSLVMGALFLVGCIHREENPSFKCSGRVLLFVFVAVPFLATVLLSLKRPAFDEKYLIAIVACYLILVAHGLRFLLNSAKAIGVVAAVLVLLAAGWSLYNYYFDPDYAKSPRWQRLVTSIEARATEDDVIIYNYPDPGLSYYYRGDLSIQLLPADASHPRERTVRALQKLADSHGRIWLVPYAASTWDAEGMVQEWLLRHCNLVDERAFGSLRLQLYHTPSTFLEQMQTVHAELGGQIELVGYQLTPAPGEALKSGEHLSLTLYWQAKTPVDTDYTVFVHLSDPNERIWGQDDRQPMNGTYPTSAWAPGQIMVDHHTIDVDPETPPGFYRLMTGLYDGATGQRLPIVAHPDAVTENRILLAEIAVPAEEGSGSGEQAP